MDTHDEAPSPDDLSRRSMELAERTDRIAADIAVTEDRIAATFEDMAEQRPHRAEHLREQARDAREFAAYERSPERRHSDGAPDRADPVGGGPVAVRLGTPVVGVSDLARAVVFWAAALDLVPTPEWASETWRTLASRDGRRVLGLMHSESAPEPRPRMHLDLFVDTTQQQETEVERLLGLGATKPEWDLYPPEPDFVVLADPDGNVFCVVDLSRAPSGSSET